LVVIGLAALRRDTRAVACVIVGMGAAKSFESVSDVIYGLFQKRERMEKIALSMSLKGVLSLTVLGACVAVTGSVAAGTAGLAITWAIVLLAYDAPTCSRMLVGREDAQLGRTVVHGPGLRALALRSLPLGVVTMLLSLISNVPRYYVDHYLGPGPLAIFTGMAYLMVAGNTVVGAIGQSASPRLARHYAEGDGPAFRRILGRLVSACAAIGVLGLVVAVVAGRPLLTLLYRPEYAEHQGAFLWIMVAASFSYVGGILGVAVTSARWFHGQTYIHAASLAVVLALNAFLVPRAGLEGAGIAIALHWLLATSAYAFVLRHILRQLKTNADRALALRQSAL